MCKVPSLKQFKILEAKIIQLAKDVAELKSENERWVDTKEALKKTGIKSEQTLKKAREREGSLIVYKTEGKRSILYSYQSLIAYSDAKAIGRHHSPMKIAS